MSTHESLSQLQNKLSTFGQSFIYIPSPPLDYIIAITDFISSINSSAYHSEVKDFLKKQNYNAIINTQI